MPNTLPWFSCTLPSCNNDQSATKIYMFLKVACLFPSGISLLYIHSSHVIVIHLSSYKLLN